VERIVSTDSTSLSQWKQGVLFSLYGWNAAPIDGTDIPRSGAAVGREYWFPIDLHLAIPREGASEGQPALEYLEVATPMLQWQCEMLYVLNEERWLRHRKLKNEGVTQR
jgi:hypothetical protein